MAKKYSAHDVYQQLRDMIIDFEIAPGTRITETQIADYFSVSRTPVRAALQRLESENLLSIKPKLGCFVRNLDMLQISAYYDVRVAMENCVIDEIIKQKPIEEIEVLASEWDPKTYYFGRKITDDLKHAEEQFHVRLAIASKNTVLVNYLNDINDHIRAVRRLGWPNDKSVVDTYQEHHDICRFILAKKSKQAKMEMTNHIRKSQDLANRITLHQIYGQNKHTSPFEA